MSRGSNQKFKLFYLIKIMLAKTDDYNGLTMPQILKELGNYGITAERKSIYADFQDMADKLGIEVLKEQVGRETYYHISSREFEFAEVKLLIDAIQASKFITQKKSDTLIKKIKTLVSEHQAKQLQRQVVIFDRVKAMNEKVYYNVDYIHTAISSDKRIQFKYYKWDINKKLIEKNNGKIYEVSPWTLIWDNENYYLIAYDSLDLKIKNYRVDKMMKISVIDIKRDGKEELEKFDVTSFSKSRFRMYNGELKRVRIEFPNELCGVFIDKFGKNIQIYKINEKISEVSVKVAVSYQFFGWIFALGKEVKVKSPVDVVEKLKLAAKEFADNYR